MRNRLGPISIALMGLLTVGVSRGEGPNPPLVDVEFPRDSPVLPVSFSLGPLTTAHVRGITMVLNLHASLLLRNTGVKAISGLTLRVEAQDLTPSGKGSVTVPSLRAGPGDVIPVHLDMELSRPMSAATTNGALVQVSLDCALFSDLTTYGPDRLESSRSLIVYELEARRDRRYLAALLRSGRIPELRQELNFGLQDFAPQQLGLELLRYRRPLSSSPQPVSVGAVAFPSSPVRPMGGEAQIAGNEVRSPAVDVKNTSSKAVRLVDMGWILRDEHGRGYVAGSLPAALNLAPIQTGRMSEPGTLRFSHAAGEPLTIGALLAFVNDVEFADGRVWIPSRDDIAQANIDPALRRALASSPEEQRLSEIYRRKGLSGLAEELRK
jgi:hypothetical protein